MKRVWIIQCLCPSRHCIAAATIEAEWDPTWARDDVADSVRIGLAFAAARLKAQIDAGIADGSFDPWCALCKAPQSDWEMEPGVTRFTTTEEARPFLKDAQAKQLITQELVKARLIDLRDLEGR
jgi:hypothetical protein